MTSGAVHAGEDVARGIIARAAKDALRDAEPVFARAAARDGLKGSAKDILKDTEEKAVGRLGQDGREAAQRVAQRAAEAEPSITSKLQRIVSHTPGVNAEAWEKGLKFRLKSEDSLLRKVAGDSEKMSVERATGGINDAVRYTITSSREEYAKVTQSAIDKMKQEGFQLVGEPKNFWGKEGYQGINSVWRDSSGQTFEMQFHTLESLDAKEATHTIYEMARVFPDGSATQAELREIQNRVFGEVVHAPGARDINFGGG